MCFCAQLVKRLKSLAKNIGFVITPYAKNFFAEMVWCFPWSEGIKKRACRYLLQHYLGRFLDTKLGLDQLSVDLYKGTGCVKDVNLDVEVKIHEKIHEYSSKNFFFEYLGIE